MFNRLSSAAQKYMPSARITLLFSVSVLTLLGTLHVMSEGSCAKFKANNPHYRCMESELEKYVMALIVALTTTPGTFYVCKMAQSLWTSFFQNPTIPPIILDDNFFNSLRKTAPAA